MNLSSSLEDYLETMLNLKKSKGTIRITDISTQLNVEKPSVNFAVKKLKNLKLVTHERYEDIKLTKKGEAEAKRIKTRHVLLRDLLQNYLGLPAETAETDACRIEHTISCETYERLIKLVEFIDTHPMIDKNNFLTMFNHFIEHNEIITIDIKQ